MYAPDGNAVYFLSERDGGSFNVYTFPLNTPQEVKAVTTFKTHPGTFFYLSAIKVPYVIPMMVSYTHRSLVHVRKKVKVETCP